jgi:hypothetical protein
MRALTNVRNAGGVIVFAVMGLLGIFELASGHERSGVLALILGGLALIFVVARLAARR